MVEKPTLLSIATDQGGEVVHIHADLSGLKHLRSELERMIESLEKNQCDHTHLRSEDWAGYELTTSMLETEKAAGCRQVHHLKISSWNDIWKIKNEL
ncbi:Imm32 family immunity protein [Aquipseudomonas alcaligenes]|uniref:Imm32 family immunity protein n=1 Tax=Aquipseudomonas alcaligenes TaxID=43263 RepID=UPI000970518F|nr:Imm32 family immunity protein [Pseudomonas alcaligenes]